MRELALDDRYKRQRAKNLTLLAVLLALVALFYALTMVKFGAPP
jgi:hypothetical protein